ncbi:interleukin-17D [Erinaceus europaeus]|uniref:Interleukin-17D n=1 Tax=Erinaceus europaeus TaxID=9365 RepID=A0ABM3XPH4_ERIEU|nr:interleukin-17D [Erinaceus europaeus]
MRALVWLLLAGAVRALPPGSAPRTGRRRCAERPEALLEPLFGRLAAGVLGAFHHALQPGPRARNASCPAGGAALHPHPPTHLRSVAPWAYRISYDPARYPRSLPEAYCLCRGCLTGPRGEEDPRFRSTPVYMPLAVLRRTAGCAGGHAVYAEEYISLAVGCTCVPAPAKDALGLNSSLDKQAGHRP